MKTRRAQDKATEVKWPTERAGLAQSACKVGFWVTCPHPGRRVLKLPITKPGQAGRLLAWYDRCCKGNFPSRLCAQAVFRAEHDVDVVADVGTGHCVVPSGLIYLNLMLPGTPVPGYRLFRPFGTRALPTGLGLSLAT